MCRFDEELRFLHPLAREIDACLLIPRGMRGEEIVGELAPREAVSEYAGVDVLLPKLLDSYAVDLILQRKGGREGGQADRVAIDFFERIRRAGSRRTDTPGSGAGIRTRSGGLLGDGVGLSGTLVHYGVQIQDRIVPMPKPMPRRRGQPEPLLQQQMQR